MTCKGGGEKVKLSGGKRPLMTAGEAVDYLRVSKSTLRLAEKSGELRPFRTPGGHKRYNVEMLNKYLRSTKGNRKESRNE